MHITGKSKKDKGNENDSISGSVSSLSTPGSGQFQERRFGGGQAIGDADPGVISEDDDEFAFDNLSNKSSASSINLKSRSTYQQLPPPPSPLATQSNSSHSTGNNNYSNDEDIKLRTKDASPSVPVKPARSTNETQKVDEWEAKLYGKHLESSADSLKRLSWDTRVPLNKDDSIEHSYGASVTAPTSPNLDEQKSREQNGKPMPMPRSGTLENIVEKQQQHQQHTPIIMDKEKKEKSEKRFSNKLKYFRKDKNETNDDGRSPKNVNGQLRQFSERIIIGHENGIMSSGHKQIEVPQELLKKYEGKSREVN